MGERLLCKQEAVGSIPSSSTRLSGEVFTDSCQLTSDSWSASRGSSVRSRSAPPLQESGISGQESAEDRAKRWHRASVSLWFLTRSYRLFFNNVEEVKVLLLPGRSWCEPRFVRVERDWVGLYRPVLALVGWGWVAQAPVMRSEVLSVMGSSD